MTDPAAGTAPGGRQAEVLAVLRGAGRPLSAAEVGAACGLHVNTARMHLDGLATEGLAERTAEPRSAPGRPRVLYSPAAVAAGPRSYRLLAEMLVGLVASLPDAGPAAVEVGRAWGRHLVERSAPSQRVDVEEAVARLTRLLDGMGFQPQLRPGGEVLLHNCPFREVAAGHTDVVCAIHLGVMQGALAEQRVPLEATELQPFVAPSLCLARLAGPRPATG
jgi:predicted ArsR family transcriptional regulator